MGLKLSEHWMQLHLHLRIFVDTFFTLFFYFMMPAETATDEKGWKPVISCIYPHPIPKSCYAFLFLLNLHHDLAITSILNLTLNEPILISSMKSLTRHDGEYT